MDGPRDYCTKWSKSDKDKYYDITWYHSYVESEKLYKWAYLQNRLIDIGNELTVTKGERGEE